MMTAAKLSIRGDWKSVEARFHLVRGLALRSWRQFFASFAVKKNLTAKNAKDSQTTQSKFLGQGANCTLPVLETANALPLICGCAPLLSAGPLPGVTLHNFKVAARTVWRAPSQGTFFLPPEIPLNARTVYFRAISPDASNAASRDTRCTPPRTAAPVDDRTRGSPQSRCARDRNAPGCCAHDGGSTSSADAPAGRGRSVRSDRQKQIQDCRFGPAPSLCACARASAAADVLSR